LRDPRRPPRLGEDESARRCEEPRARIVRGDIRETPPGDRHHLGGYPIGVTAPAATGVRRDRPELIEDEPKARLGAGVIETVVHTPYCRMTPIALQRG
jgi:hypothetical protein